jgi:hypothetical protein
LGSHPTSARDGGIGGSRSSRYHPQVRNIHIHHISRFRRSHRLRPFPAFPGSTCRSVGATRHILTVPSRHHSVGCRVTSSTNPLRANSSSRCRAFCTLLFGVSPPLHHSTGHQSTSHQSTAHRGGRK